jgi:hypothetical protein
MAAILSVRDACEDAMFDVRGVDTDEESSEEGKGQEQIEERPVPRRIFQELASPPA